MPRPPAIHKVGAFRSPYQTPVAPKSKSPTLLKRGSVLRTLSACVRGMRQRACKPAYQLLPRRAHPGSPERLHASPPSDPAACEWLIEMPVLTRSGSARFAGRTIP
jgi:hypothetical protein